MTAGCRGSRLAATYGGFLATLHPDAWKEVEAMAKTKSKGFDFHIEPLIEAVGLRRIIDTVGEERVLRAIRSLTDEKGVAWLLSQMSAEQRRELKDRLRKAARSRLVSECASGGSRSARRPRTAVRRQTC